MLGDFRLTGMDLGSEVWRGRGGQMRCHGNDGSSGSDGSVHAGLQDTPESQRMGTPALA